MSTRISLHVGSHIATLEQERHALRIVLYVCFHLAESGSGFGLGEPTAGMSLSRLRLLIGRRRFFEAVIHVDAMKDPTNPISTLQQRHGDSADGR